MSEKKGQNLPQRTYGGCEGPNSEYIKLISANEYEFIVKREHALISETIKRILRRQVVYRENESVTVALPSMESYVVKDVCRYFTFAAKYYVEDTDRIPDFPVDSEVALQLTIAARFLQC